jgi:hypothetical protein
MQNIIVVVLLQGVKKRGRFVLVNIKTIAFLMVVIFSLALSTVYFKRQATKTALALHTLQTQSNQIFADKQAEKDVIETRANEFLKKAKVDYENNIKRIVVTKPYSLPINQSPNQSDPLPSVQIPAPRNEALITCETKLKGLWDSWQGLCLIYGCEQ